MSEAMDTAPATRGGLFGGRREQEQIYLPSKDLLGLKQLNQAELNLIMDTTQMMKQALLGGHKKIAWLQGKSVIILFYENSTRTKISFELAAKYTGAVTSTVSTVSSSERKGETLYDTARTLDAMEVDFIIIRHDQSGVPHFLSKQVQASIINAGDGMDEHPTQALLDMFTMREHFDSLDGLEVAIVGDVSFSRVARSNIIGLTKMGARIRLAGPRQQLPEGIERLGNVTVMRDRREACAGAQVIMALRPQLERQNRSLFPSTGEYARFFSVDASMLALAAPNAIIMHPGPANRGVEISSEMHDCSASVIEEQVTNGIAVRMAILYLLNIRRNAQKSGIIGGGEV